VTADQEQWQLAGSAPELYQRYLVPAVTLQWAIDLVARVGVRSRDRVLDVACGTGVVARCAAERVGSGGYVAGLDLNPGMLSVARSLPQAPCASIDWREGSALGLPFADAEFGVVLCQLGLQFVPKRLVALREMRRVLVHGGRVGLSVYGPIERSPAAHALADALDRHVGEGASGTKRSEHSLCDAEELRQLVQAAGFTRVRVETVVKTVRFASAEEFLRIQLRATPLADVLAQHGAQTHGGVFALVADDIRARLAAFSSQEGLALPQEAHIALARA
jgi:ubiquinone/menaquinone biosynthesis C-methylase UbiE